jgi:hypothetical protein
MSLDLNFDKSISVDEIIKKTNLKVVEENGVNFLEDEYGNVVYFKGYGVTLYGGPRNPKKILDELIKVFGVKFIDDEAIDMYDYEPEKYKDIDLFIPTMLNYGYLLGFDGKIVVPKREESEYLPFRTKEKDDDGDGLPF